MPSSQASTAAEMNVRREWLVFPAAHALSSVYAFKREWEDMSCWHPVQSVGNVLAYIRSAN